MISVILTCGLVDMIVLVPIVLHICIYVFTVCDNIYSEQNYGTLQYFIAIFVFTSTYIPTKIVINYI